MQLGRSSRNWTLTEIDTQSLSSQRHYHQQNETTRSTTGTASNNPRPGIMAPLYPRISAYYDCAIRPQELNILSRSQKAEPTTSTMVLIPVRIRCETRAYTWKQNGTV